MRVDEKFTGEMCTSLLFSNEVKMNGAFSWNAKSAASSSQLPSHHSWT
jgi:hypothetical protein